MGIRFSESAIKASFLVENPDWYTFNCTKVLKKASDKGDSFNYIFIWEGKTGEMAGVPVSVLISEKADWIMYPLFKAINGGVDLTADSEVNPEDVTGITLEGYCKRGARQDGTPMNQIVEWRPVVKN